MLINTLKYLSMNYIVYHSSAPMYNRPSDDITTPPGFESPYDECKPKELNPRRQLSEIISHTFSGFSQQYPRPNYVPFPQQPYDQFMFQKDPAVYSPIKQTSSLSTTMLPIIVPGQTTPETAFQFPSSSLSSSHLSGISDFNKGIGLPIEAGGLSPGKKEYKTNLELLLFNNTLMDSILDSKKGQSLQKDLAKCGPLVIEEIINRVSN
jgi:hypothetical protein